MELRRKYLHDFILEKQHTKKTKRHKSVRMMTSDLPARSGRDQDWDWWSSCASPPLLSLLAPPSPAAFDRNPWPPHQGAGESASRPQSSSPPCWAADGQLSTPRRSCGEKIWSKASTLSRFLSAQSPWKCDGKRKSATFPRQMCCLLCWNVPMVQVLCFPGRQLLYLYVLLRFFTSNHLHINIIVYRKHRSQWLNPKGTVPHS